MKTDLERTFSNFMAGMASVSRHTMSASVSSTERHVDEAGRIFEGQLYKFTNVVKGWQYRYEFPYGFSWYNVQSIKYACSYQVLLLKYVLIM